MTTQSKSFLLVFSLSAVLIFPWIGLREFHTRGEAREALAVRSVAEGGNLILPRGYGGVIASKPPLYHWIGGAASRFTKGVSEFSARFPSSLASILFVSFLFFFLASRLGERTAFLSSLILITTAEWFRHAIVTRVDMILSTMVAASLLCAYSDFEKRKKFPSLGTILLSSLAVLSKGPVGIVLPAFIMGVFNLVRGRSYREVFVYLASFAALTAVLPLIWYIAAIKEGGEEFKNLFLSENIMRFFGSGEGDVPHQRGIFAFYAAIFLGLSPWSFLILPELLEKGFSSFKKWQKESSILTFSSKGDRIRALLKLSFWKKIGSDTFLLLKAKAHEASDLKLFSVCVIVCTLIFFSIPSGKRSVYALPCYPFIAVLASSYLLHLTRLRHRYVAWTLFALAVLTSLFCIGVIIASLFEVKTVYTLTLSSAPNLSLLSGVLIGVCLIISGWIFAKIFYGSRRSYVPAAISLFYSVYLFVHATIAPLVSESLSSKGFSRAVSREIGPEDPIYSFKYEFYGLSYYLDRPMKTIESDFVDGMWLVLYESKLDELRSALPKELSFQVVIRSARQIEKFGEHAVAVRLRKEL